MFRYRKTPVPPPEAELAIRALLVLMLGALLFLGILSVRFLVAERRAREALNARLGAIEVGWTEAQVLATAGEPDATCEGDGALARRAPQTGLFYVDRHLIRRLARRTRQRFIYRSVVMRGEPHETCLPGYADAELGFDDRGRLLWYVRFTDESYLVSALP